MKMSASEIPVEQTERLIELVRGNKALYDSRLPNWMYPPEMFSFHFFFFLIKLSEIDTTTTPSYSTCNLERISFE